MTAPLPRGVLLAGGTGSRLLPLTRVTNKHLLPVGEVPMIFHPLRSLARAGIREVLVVTGVEHMGDVVGTLGSGREFGLDLTWRVQDESGGIAQALGLAESFAAGGPVVVVLGDNVFAAPLRPEIDAFVRDGGARVLLSEVSDPSRFGCPRFDGGAMVGIDEKPQEPGSPYAVTGIYMYGADVFDVIRTLTPSARGELEITDVNNHYLRSGTLRWGLLDGPWTDAGTHESLARANRLARGPEFAL
jgi:glucose-1-phosphate thymidylyltransferase